MGLTEDLKDIEDIKRVKHNYAHYFDGGEIDKLADLFCEDAICEFGENYGGNWVGREMIRERYRGVGGERPPFSFMHAVTNPVIDLNGDTATGRWFLLDLSMSPERTNPLTLVGIYDEDYRRVNGEWKISRSRIDFLWPKRSI